jgi:hypothetical protein
VIREGSRRQECRCCRLESLLHATSKGRLRSFVPGKRDVERVMRRLAVAQRDYEERYGKAE